MSLEAWGDTDEHLNIDPDDYPVAVALADVRDEVGRRMSERQREMTEVNERSVHAGERRRHLQGLIDELQWVYRNLDARVGASGATMNDVSEG